MNTKLITLVITLVVGVILAGSLLVPVLNDITTTERTFTNDGYYAMSKLTANDTETYTLSWDVSEPNIITVNDVETSTTTWGTVTNMAFSIFATETDIFRIGFGNSTNLEWVQIRGDTYNYASATSTFTATISEGTVSVLMDTTETPYELTYTTAYLIDPTDTSGYVMKLTNEAAYVMADTEIVGMGISPVNNVSYVMRVVGNASEVSSVDVDVIKITNAAPDVTISDIAIDSTDVSGYNDLMTFNKFTFKATPTGGTATNVTYSYVIVPAEVTAELSQHLTSGQNALLGAIPILVIVSLVLAAVGMIYGGRND